MGQDNSTPQPGDLIEIDRPVYQHWALYTGNGYVIHLADEAAHSSSGIITEQRNGTVMVKKELLTMVAGKNWRVNNKYDRSRTPRRVREIIQRAERRVGKEVCYDVPTNNCEHFVTKLRYEVELCDQKEQSSSDGAVVAIGAIVAGAVAVTAMILSRI